MYRDRVFRWFVVICVFLSHNAFTQDPASENSPIKLNSSSLLPDGQSNALSDQENLLLIRMNAALRKGNSPAMMSYYGSLMQSFISKDEQNNILEYSLLFLPKLLAYRNYSFSKDLLSHLRYRLDYYFQEQPENKKHYENLLSLYEGLLYLLPQSSLFQAPPPYMKYDSLKEQLTPKPSIDNILINTILGLTGKQGRVKESLQYLYAALNTANLLYSSEMYYVISIVLLRVYISQEMYSNALVRLRFLYNLFSIADFSDFFRLKILTYFVQVYLLNGDTAKAYVVYLRVQDILKYNYAIDADENTKMKEALEQFAPRFKKYEQDEQANKTRAFLNHFIDGTNNTTNALVE